jgi:hypothetical protein
MKAVRVVLVAREALRVVFGVRSASPVTSWMPACSIISPENALTAPGTSWISSSRRRAVTTMLSALVALPALPAGAPPAWASWMFFSLFSPACSAFLSGSAAGVWACAAGTSTACERASARAACSTRMLGLRCFGMKPPGVSDRCCCLVARHVGVRVGRNLDLSPRFRQPLIQRWMNIELIPDQQLTIHLMMNLTK